MNKSESKYFNTAKRMDEALLSLMEEKAFEYITISEICKRANVNRSTFYLYYENTVDLLSETVQFVLDNFTSYFNISEFNLDDKELKDLILISDEYINPYLLYIKENKNIFSTVLRHSDSFGFNNIFTRLFEGVFNPILERYAYPVSHRKYVMKFYLNGIIAIIAEWIKEDCKMPFEEVSSVINECIFGLNNEIFNK